MFNIYIFFSKIVSYMRQRGKMLYSTQTTNENIIWRMWIECWIRKATNTSSEYAMFTTFPLQQLLHQRASMLCYTYIAYLVVTCLSFDRPRSLRLQLVVMIMIAVMMMMSTVVTVAVRNKFSKKKILYQQCCICQKKTRLWHETFL